MRRSTVYLFYACLLICCISCGEEGVGKKNVRVNDGKVTVVLHESDEAFRNPMKGLREFFQPGVDKKRSNYPYPYGSMVKEYMQWDKLEEEATDGVDRIIAYSNHRWAGVEAMNMKVVPRVFLVWVEPWHGGREKNQSNPDDLTGWHWPKGIPAETGPYKQIAGSVGAMVEPSDSSTPIAGGYFHPDFPDRVRNLVHKLGIAWDNDPRVAYVEMGIVGEWGEHHDPDLSTYWPPHDEPKHVINRTWVPGLEKVLGDAFQDAFKNKKVMVRYAYEFKDYEFGIYWDSWSQKEEEVRGYEEMMKLGERWKTQPIGGEITWNWGSLQKFNSFEEVLKDPEYFRITLFQVRNLHANHLGGITWANFNDTTFLEKAGELQKALGYRFVITEASYPVKVEGVKAPEVTLTIENRGSSPFYYNWPVQLVLLDAVTKQPVWKSEPQQVGLHNWHPGSDWDSVKQSYCRPATQYTVNLNFKPTGIPHGNYLLAVTVLDPAGNQPSLRFANTNYISGGYTVLGITGIGKQPESFVVPAAIFTSINADTTLHYANIKQ